jgi:hypothetical protein
VAVKQQQQQREDKPSSSYNVTCKQRRHRCNNRCCTAAFSFNRNSFRSNTFKKLLQQPHKNKLSNYNRVRVLAVLQ